MYKQYLTILSLSALLLGLTACDQANSSNKGAEQTQALNAQEDSPNKSKYENKKDSDMHVDLKNNYRKHAALAQFHRWYLFYENAQTGIENQLDILTDNVYVQSVLGEANGHAAYKERVAQLPNDWKNAHFVQDVDVTLNEDGSADLKAELRYLNQGILPDGQVRQAELAYAMKLLAGNEFIPKFSDIRITPVSDGIVEEYKDAYAENRLRSLVHYWLALVENPQRKSEPFKEILADEYALNFSSGVIDDFAKFDAWVKGPASSVVASKHVIENFTVQEVADQNYIITMELDWHGLLPNQSELEARTRHTWQVVDDPSERFARIKVMDVEILKPFQPKARD